jgi:hypothetical protein
MLGIAALLPAGPQGGSRPLTSLERAGIEAAVKDQLNDPASATFRHNPYRIGSTFYCARVNAKNRFGGYVGYRIFLIRVEGGKVGAKPLPGGAGEPTVLRTGNQFDGGSAEQLLFMITESRCSSEGYDTGYTAVKVK